MKKTIIMTIILAIILSMVTVVNAATKTQTIKITGTPVEIKPGTETATVTFKFDEKFTTGQYTVKYNKDLLTLKTTSQGADGLSGEEGNKTTNFMGANTDTITLTFNVNKDAKVGDKATVTIVPTNFANTTATEGGNYVLYSIAEASTTVSVVAAVSEPAASQPASRPATSQPATSQPASQPATSQPASRPATSQPASQPATSQPASRPATSRPATSQPAANTPAEMPQTGFNIAYLFAGVAGIAVVAGLTLVVRRKLNK